MNKEVVRSSSFYRREPVFCPFPISSYSEELEEDSESNEGEDEKGERKEDVITMRKPGETARPANLRQFNSRRTSRGNIFGRVSQCGPSRSLSFNTTRDKIRVQELRGVPPKSPTLSTSRPQSPQRSHPGSPLSVGSSLSLNRKSMGPVDSKLVVLGLPCVGKSAIVVRILTGRFIWEYDPTLEAVYRHHTTVDDDPATIEILDTAGLIDGRLNEGHVRWADGFVLVYSLTDRSSFIAVPEIHASIASLKHTPNFPCVLLANKSDLVHLSKISEEEGATLASDLGVAFFSASACDGSPALWEAFAELHRDVVRRMRSRTRRRSSVTRRSSAKVVIEGFYKIFSR